MTNAEVIEVIIMVAAIVLVVNASCHIAYLRGFKKGVQTMCGYRKTMSEELGIVNDKQKGQEKTD